MKLSKLSMAAAIFLALLLIPVQARAASDAIFHGCKNTPLELSLSSPIISSDGITFECEDKCDFKYRHTGIEISSGIFLTYQLTFLTAGEHRVSIFRNGIFQSRATMIIADSHSYQCTEKKATCTQSGSRKYICSNCRNEYTETIPATGHNYILADRTQPTCTEAGYESRICANCGNHTQKTLPATGHDWTNWKTLKQATLFTPGKKTRSCAKCRNKETQTIPKKPSKASLSKDSLYIKTGRQTQLKLKEKTKGDQIASWHSSRSWVAAVNKKTGKIKALRGGTTLITLKMKSGCTATCRLLVYDRIQKANSKSPNERYIVPFR